MSTYCHSLSRTSCHEHVFDIVTHCHEQMSSLSRIVTNTHCHELATQISQCAPSTSYARGNARLDISTPCHPLSRTRIVTNVPHRRRDARLDMSTDSHEHSLSRTCHTDFTVRPEHREHKKNPGAPKYVPAPEKDWGPMQRAPVSCSVLQCAVVYGRAWQCIAMYCSVSNCVAECCRVL